MQTEYFVFDAKMNPKGKVAQKQAKVLASVDLDLGT